MTTLEALHKFEQLLVDINKQNSPRDHKRLKFVNKSLLEHNLVEQKLYDYAVSNMTTQQQEGLRTSLANCVGECRVCEYLLAVIKHSEERIDRHEELFRVVMDLVQTTRKECEDNEAALAAIEKCSLVIFDSFHFLVSVKRLIAEVATVYHIPYYYDTGSAGIMRLRAGLLSTYKNLNVIIDDLSTLSDALFVVRNFDAI